MAQSNGNGRKGILKKEVSAQKEEPIVDGVLLALEHAIKAKKRVFVSAGGAIPSGKHAIVMPIPQRDFLGKPY